MATLLPLWLLLYVIKITVDHVVGSSHLNDPNNNMRRLAQELTTAAIKKDVYLGEALRLLSCAPYSGYAFPLVRKIELEFFMARADKTSNPGKANKANALETKTNIDCFVQRIKEMAAMVSDIGVKVKKVVWAFKGPNCFFSDLVWRLFQLAKRVAYNDHGKPLMSLESQQNQICDLVHIQYSMEASNGPFTQLTQRISLEIFVMLRKHGVFMLTSHPKLLDVTLTLSYGPIVYSFASAADFMPFILSIGPGASKCTHFDT
ncbi:hypothetical protein GGI20_005799 [Coemansia sp. BCRC 34301]|nr:hypothetical protein GGI20_005799 [Coemansia sp. BCRC 34301]